MEPNSNLNKMKTCPVRSYVKGQRPEIFCSFGLPLSYPSSLYWSIAEKRQELDHNKNTAYTRIVNQGLFKTLTQQESAFQFHRPEKEKEVKTR